MQDTIVGLESLATYSQFIKDRTLEMNNENGLVLQMIDLTSNTESIQLSASGHGFALFQLSYRYNVNNNDTHTNFTFKPNVLEVTAHLLVVEICSRFVQNKFFQMIKNCNISYLKIPSEEY